MINGLILHHIYMGIIKSHLLRSIAIVATGKAGAQIVTIMLSPIITRLYGPEEFGLLGTFMAILAVLSPMAALTYPIAIVLPKEDAVARELAAFSVVLAAFLSFLCFVLFCFYDDLLMVFLGGEGVFEYLWLIPLAMFMSALHQVLEQWIIRSEKFKILAKIAVLQSLFSNGAKVGVGFWYPFSLTLVILQVLMSGFYSILLWLGVKKECGRSFFSIRDTALFTKKTIFKYKDFPIYRAPQVALNALSQNIPVLFLAVFFGSASVGLFVLARSVINLPMVILPKAFLDVFYPKVSGMYNDGENVFNLVLKSTIILSVLGFFPFFSVVLFGPFLFSMLFGSEWVAAGEFARWISIWVFFGFINRPCVAVIPVLNMQRWLLFYELFSAGAKGISFFFGVVFFDDEVLAVALMCISGVVSYLFLISNVMVKLYFGGGREEAGFKRAL